MSRNTIRALRADLRKLSAQDSRRFLRRLGGLFIDEVGRTSVRKYMRLTSPAEGRRKRSDRGPLRMVTRRLGRSILGTRYRGRLESIRSVKVRGMRARAVIGSAVPYARVHELGINQRVRVRASARAKAHDRHMRIPARTYLRTAANDAVPRLAKLAERELVMFLRTALEV